MGPLRHLRPWFGRAADRAAAADRLREPGVVVLTGPPGIGKTGLARQLAAEWSGEVAWVELDGATTGDEVDARVGSALGIPSREGEPPIGPALRARPGALVVLDHPEGAIGPVEERLARWSAEAPLRCVVASRVRLPGHPSSTVGPLDPADAAALYHERAAAVLPEVVLDPDAVRALVEALDHLPLALELAAARVRLFPPERLVQQHRFAPLVDPHRAGRHGSLDAALAVSWDLLSADQRLGLAAASVIGGPFDAEAFAQVTGYDASVLEGLLDASLVSWVGAGCVRVLQIVREFAAAHLEPEAAQQVGHRHAAWALAVGEAATLAARRHGDWTAVHDRKADLARVLARGGEDAARAALVLGELALARGPRVDPTGAVAVVPDGLQVRFACLRSRFLLDGARNAAALALLGAVRPPTDPTDRLRLAVHRMMHLRQLNRGDEGVQALAEAERAAVYADELEVATFRVAEAVFREWRGDHDGAVAALEAVAPAEPAPAIEARVLAYLGGLLVRRPSTRARGMASLEQALALYRRIGDEGWEGAVLLWLGGAMFEAGWLDAAAARLTRAAEASARVGDVRFEASALEHLAAVRIEERRWDEVAQLHARLRASPQPPSILALLHAQEGLVEHARGRPDLAVVHYELALAGFESLGRRGLCTTYRAFLALADPARGPGVLAAADADAVGLGEHFPALIRLARESIAGGPSAEALADASEHERADVRIFLSLLSRPIRVAGDGSWFEAAGERVSLERRAVLRRTLAALAGAGPGRWVERAALVAAVWPGERMVGNSADARLHTTVRALRRLGLADRLRTHDEGGLCYGLDASVVVVSG